MEQGRTVVALVRSKTRLCIDILVSHNSSSSFRNAGASCTTCKEGREVNLVAVLTHMPSAGNMLQQQFVLFIAFECLYFILKWQTSIVNTHNVLYMMLEADEIINSVY